MINVLKFGGTSMGSAESMRSAAKILTAEKSRITVLSAMSGTTDSLIKIYTLASQGNNKSAIREETDSLKAKYSACIENLLTRRRDEAFLIMEETFDTIQKEVSNYRKYISERTIIAQGELLTSAIFTLFMKESGHKAELLYAPGFMHKDDEDRINVGDVVRELQIIAADPDTFYITQGFICTNSRGGLDNLGRGGSDYSAAIMAAAINANQLQVWTDIDGMHNNDPRYVDNTYPIHHMSFDEAAELAYFGAKILHPATIQPCKDKGIPVLLKNTMDPEAEGTKISDRDDSSVPFHAVAAKDGITVVRITSARMLQAYGFLRKVFEVFEEHRTPIDMITTSEVAISLTIDHDEHLEQIVKELEDLGTVEVDRENSIVCIVGCLNRTAYGLIAKITMGIGNIPIKMISYGASNRSIAMLVDTPHKKDLLQRLNDTMFSPDNNKWL